MLTKYLTNWKKNLKVLIYLGFFLLLSLKVVYLRLLIDDNDHIFPALLGTYTDHFLNTMYVYGFWRPFAWIYYYLIYSFYLMSPEITHLLVLLIHFTGVYFLNKILEKVFNRKTALILAMIFAVFPFATEQFGWLAASNATITNLILFLQINLILDDKRNRQQKITQVALLQLAGIFFYESVFFTFIPLIVLFYRENRQHQERFSKLVDYGLLAFPSIFYFALRNLIFPPHSQSTVRDLALKDFLSGKYIAVSIDNIFRFLDNLNYLFLQQGPLLVFWKGAVIGGLTLIMTNPVSLVVFFGLLILFYKEYLLQPLSGGSEPIYIAQNHKAKSNLNAGFWLQLAFFSLLPSLLLVQPSYPFRVITLPLYFVLIALYLRLEKLLPKYALTFLLLILLICATVTTQMLQQMHDQAIDDENLLGDIVVNIDKSVSDGQQTQVVLHNVPHSTQTVFSYGEYLTTCLSNDWCLYPALTRRTGKVSSVLVNPDDSYTPNGTAVELFYNVGEKNFELR